MLTSKILSHRRRPVPISGMGPGLRGCQEILRTGKFVVPAKAGTQEQATEIPGFPLSRERRVLRRRAPNSAIGLQPLSRERRESSGNSSRSLGSILGRALKPVCAILPKIGAGRTYDLSERGRCAMKLSDEKLFRQQCYINGEWVDALNRGTIPVTNPATGETLGTVPRMGAEETRQAIEAADRALPGWRVKTAKERAQILRKWFDLMMANQEDLAILMTAEQGKPLTESRGE